MEESTEEVKKTSPPKSFGPIVVSILVVLVAAAFYWFGGKGYFSPVSKPSITPQTEMSTETPAESEIQATSTPKPTPTPKPTTTPSPTPSPTPTPTPTAEAKADLYISEYSFDHAPKQGEAFTVKIGIYNKGNKAASGFWWEWWATTSAPTYACRQRIDSLAAHGGRIVYCTYTYGGWANYTTKAASDTDNEVPESDEGNNSYTQNVIPIH